MERQDYLNGSYIVSHDLIPLPILTAAPSETCCRGNHELQGQVFA